MADPTIISTAIASVVGLAGGGALASWRKAGAESESVAVATMRVVIGELRTELDHKDEELDRQRRELAQLRGRLNEAETALNEAMNQPPPHLA